MAVTWMSLDVFASNLGNRDFAAFYRSGQGWLQTGDLYDPDAIPNVNINPPHVSVLLFVPMLLFPLPTAAVVWLALQALAGVAALLLVQRELHIPARRLCWIVPLFLASCAVQHHWREGQVAGVLLLISTIAWRAARHDLSATTPWSAAAITLKPWLVCWLPVLSRRRWLWTIALGLVVVLLAVVLQGLDTWTEWAATLQSKPVRPNVINLSLLAAISRARGTTLINAGGGWPYGEPLWIFLLVLVVALTWRARSGDLDRAWLAFGLAGMLTSPLGWAYYLVAITGPLLAWGETHGWPRPAVIGVGLLMMTRELMEWLDVGPTAWIGSSLAFFGVLLLWATALWWREPAAHGRLPRTSVSAQPNAPQSAQDSFSPVRMR